MSEVDERPSLGPAIAPGPNENPYEQDYTWWEDDGKAYYRGHEFTVVCECDEEMDYDGLVGEGQMFHFHCPECTYEETDVLNGGTTEQNRSLDICPNSGLPSNWQVFTSEEYDCGDIERGDESWSIQWPDRDGDGFELRSETLFEEVTN